MDIKITYSDKDVQDLVLAAHIKKFGEPDAGEQWVVSDRYGRIDVKNEPIPKPPEPEANVIVEDPDFSLVEDEEPKLEGKNNGTS